jgi:hypothetical protein
MGKTKEPKKDYLDAVRDFALSCQGRKKSYFQKLKDKQKQAKLRKSFEIENNISPDNQK